MSSWEACSIQCVLHCRLVGCLVRNYIMIKLFLLSRNLSLGAALSREADVLLGYHLLHPWLSNWCGWFPFEKFPHLSSKVRIPTLNDHECCVALTPGAWWMCCPWGFRSEWLPESRDEASFLVGAESGTGSEWKLQRLVHSELVLYLKASLQIF